MELPLVALDAEDVVAAYCNYMNRQRFAESHGINRYDSSLKFEHFEQPGDGGYLVGFLANQDLCEGDSGLASLGADGMKMGGFFTTTATQGLVVDARCKNGRFEGLEDA